MSKIKGTMFNIAKTLRIAAIVGVIAVGAIIIYAGTRNSKTDKKIKELITSETAIEKFKRDQGNRQKNKQDQIPPLVTQAHAFALYLNPPAPITPIRDTSRPGPIKPVETPATFKLVGISYCPSNPQLSLVLIDEIGKGLHWVKQSSSIGHLQIQEIKNDVVIVKDGQRTVSLAPERQPKPSLIKGENNTSPSSQSSQISSQQTIPVVAANIATPQPEMSEEQLMKMLRDLVPDVNLPLPDTNNSSPANAARISPEEAQRISTIGTTNENSKIAPASPPPSRPINRRRPLPRK